MIPPRSFKQKTRDWTSSRRSRPFEDRSANAPAQAECAAQAGAHSSGASGQQLLDVRPQPVAIALSRPSYMAMSRRVALAQTLAVIVVGIAAWVL